MPSSEETARQLVGRINAHGMETYGSEHRLGSCEMDMIAAELGAVREFAIDNFKAGLKRVHGIDVDAMVAEKMAAHAD